MIFMATARPACPEKTCRGLSCQCHPRTVSTGAILPATLGNKKCQSPKNRSIRRLDFRHRCLHVPYLFFTSNISPFWNPSRFKMCWLDEHLIQSCFLSNILVHVNWKTPWRLRVAQIWVINHCRFELSHLVEAKSRFALDILRIKYPYAA